MTRKSEAKELLCPRCSQPTLIKAGFTKSKYGKWQRFKCLNPKCDLKATTTPKLNEIIKEVSIMQGEEIIIIKRDTRGHFAPRNK
jgi:transposase-like protein